MTTGTNTTAAIDPEVHRVLTEKVFPRRAEIVTTAELATLCTAGETATQQASRH
ncbi:hypothetical protein AB0O64_29375 [Streptomyces sp. NPDC088341]|uniref:hypothetical protein n=1 Tax=Streptomyces sp. NPDC088341 TaxID=3154870 RepID=UPI003436F942